MITREQVADLQPGDVVRTTGWYGLTVEGPLSPSIDDSLWLGQHQLIRDADGEVGHWAKGGSTLTVVSRAPRPLYVNHPRTEPVWGDVARSAEPGDADDPSTWVHLPSDGYNVGLWASVTSSEDLIRCRRVHLPTRLRLLVDGETGQVVP